MSDVNASGITSLERKEQRLRMDELWLASSAGCIARISRHACQPTDALSRARLALSEDRESNGDRKIRMRPSIGKDEITFGGR